MTFLPTSQACRRSLDFTRRFLELPALGLGSPVCILAGLGRNGETGRCGAREREGVTGSSLSLKISWGSFQTRALAMGGGPSV